MGHSLQGKIKTLLLPLLLIPFFVLIMPKAAHAAINPQINFQGKLTNTDGTNVTNGTYSIVFSIYTVASGGSNIWTETQGSVSVTDGIFRVALGSVTALPGSVDFNTNSLFLGIKVGADAEMTPRVQFTAAPYAFNSDLLDGISSGGFAQLGLAAAQTDSSTNSAIFINKTSTGNQVQLQASGTDVFTVTNSGSLTLGQNAAKTIAVAQTATNAAGQTLTIVAGQGGAGASANAGGLLTLQGGAGGGTNGAGGNILLSAGAGTGSGVVGSVVVKNPTDSTAAFQVQNAAGTTTVFAVDTTSSLVSIAGGVLVNALDNSIVRTSSADFALGTIGSDLVNSTTPTGQLELSDGTIPNSGAGTITTAGQPAVDAAIGAGASGVTRADGKYLIIKGGSTLATSLYDSIAGTFTNSQTLVVGAGTVGVGSLLLPRASGMYVVVLANGVVNTSNLDPMGVVTSTAGPSLTATAGAGTVAFKRPDGKYLVTLGGGAGTTNVYDPVANTFVAGPTNSGAVAWGIGSLALSRPDGTALFITGGATSTTQIYNPSTANPSIGAFSGVGPSLDGSQAAGTCGINNLGSVAIRRADGKFIILSKAGVSSIYDPVANTFNCRSAIGPAAALGNGAHAIPLQDGKFLIVRGGATTTAYVYDPVADTFTAHGTALSTITTGAFSLMRPDGTWQIFAGSATTTNNYNTGLPMTGTTTKYTTDDISTTALNASSVLKWTAQFESPYVGTNAATNTAFSTVQFFVRTATNSSGCTTPLNSATDKELQSSGDFIRPANGENCIRITVQFNRPIPKRINDERGTWTGNSSTVHRLDYATPTLFDVSVDNSTVVHRDNFTFSGAASQQVNNGTIPTAPTSGAPSAGGACTAGNHFWFVTFVTAGAESRLSAASAVQNCTAGNGTVALTAIPTGPSGTSARKIYRTSSGKLVTDSAFLLTTINDNVTTSFNDTIADTSLGAVYAQTETSGPVTTKVESINGQLTLPYGRITPTTLAGTTQFYMGNTTAAHPNLTQAQTNTGTIVIARPNKTFVVIAALTVPAANASLYDPATQTFTALAGSSIPTAANGAGSFATKRPDGKYLVVLGNSTTTTNIYDPDSNTFSAGPNLSGNAAVGASAIINTDGSMTIVHGGGLTTSSIYDPIRNTVITGPTLTTAANCGFWAIPLQNGMYKTFVGVASGVVGVTTAMNYNPATKTFVAGTALTGAHGCGSFAFQRQDGFWVSIAAAGGAAGVASNLTSIINPVDGTSLAGPTLTNVAGLGAHMIPRADGTFLVISGSAATTSTIYIPYGGTFGAGAGIGANTNGPTITATSQGAVSFQRPDGKWVIINGNATQATQLADVGWYADGQYLSEQMQVPALVANSVINWRQTTDNFVRMEVKTASSQAALASSQFRSVGRPGTSIGNAGGETWVQVEANFRRDFPTFSGALSGVYASGGGMVYPYRSISLPAVISYDINNGSDLLTLQSEGLNVFRVTSEGNIYSSSNGGFYTGGADLAENYTSSESLVAGEVVAIDSSNNHSVKRSTGQYQNNVLGVVSTAPGFVAGAFTEDSYPVALVGRVPVKISTENGPIKEGDFLTAASIPGYAMKATLSGRVIGTALESFSSTNATVCPSFAAGNIATTKCGSVMMFVNLTDYQGASIEAMMQDDLAGQLTGDAYISGVDFPDIEGLIGTKQENILGFLKVLKARQAAGQAPVGSGIVTNRLSAIDEVISPVIVADIIRAKTIQATNIQGLEVYTNRVSSLADAYEGLKAQALVGAPPNTNLASVTFNSGVFSVSLVTLGTFEARGGITVDGQSQFNGKTTFAALVEFMNVANFNNDTNFTGRATFNKDAGGIAVLSKGATRVNISFDKEYAAPPIVSAQLTAVARQLPDGTFEDSKVAEGRILSAGYSYIISNVQAKGFTIVLSKPAQEDIQFNWNALAVKDAATVTGMPDTNEGQ